MNQLQFSPFRRSLLAGACDDGVLYTWDSNTKTQMRRFDVEVAGRHSTPCTGLAFSPCNQMLLVSIGLDKRILCYDVVTNKLVTFGFLTHLHTYLNSACDLLVVIVGCQRLTDYLSSTN